MNANSDDQVSFTAMDIIASPNNSGKYLLIATDDENGRIIMFKTFNTINCGIDDQQNKINKNESITSSTLIQLANFYDIPSPESPSPTIPLIEITLAFIRKVFLCLLVEKLKGHVKNNGNSKISNLESDNNKSSGHSDGNSESDNDKLSGHSDVVSEMWYNEEKDLLITCGFDKCVKIWGSDELCRELIKDLKEEGEKKRIQVLFVRRNTIV
ncbi:24459_t:CDS:2 [Gigaspora margarita]|uniref:24459_t:CDS:1 n=1 Tax=Gigaspora margarita TaxID=4874 RepID=A0ABN7UM89_GIGMA|nr:24459_t:CDS:2 [Gigaspora margarita]